MDSLDGLLLARIQFAANITFHILFPTIMVYLGCMALLPVFEADGRELNIWDFAGVLILFGSVIYVFIADEQLRRFRTNPENKGKTIMSGLWKLSRQTFSRIPGPFESRFRCFWVLRNCPCVGGINPRETLTQSLDRHSFWHGRHPFRIQPFAQSPL